MNEKSTNNTLCFYCSKNSSHNGLEHKVFLFSKIGSNLGVGLLGLKRTTKYYEVQIVVPRCQNCFEEHRRPHKPALITGAIIFVLTFIVSVFTARRWYIVIPVSFIIGFVASLVYYGVVYRKRIKSLGIIDANDIRDYPPIREMLDKGWSTIKP
jgi:hypothetical protein